MGIKINGVVRKLLLVIAVIMSFTAAISAGTCAVNSGTTYQTISGFGASSQWVESKITSALATDFWADDTVNGHAGLSIIRLGVDDSGNSNWGTACNSAKQAIAINPNVRVFASPWSPPAKWKNNNATSGNNTGNTSGNPGSNTNQINTSHYSDYATYLTNFVKACKTTYGFDLYALSIQNEPDYDTSYDSCLWSAAMFDTFIGTYLGPALQTAGYSPIIMMPESFACNMSLAATTMADSNAAKYVRAIGMHLYGGGPNPMPASYSTVAGHQVEMWETETSEKTSTNDITSGLYYANQLHKCIVDNNYNAYCYWWLVNSNSDDEGLCDSSGNTTKRLYTLGNYSKFIKPGAVRVSCTENPSSNVNASAYIDTTLNRYTIVCVNSNSSAQNTTFNLTGISTTSVVPWITDASNNLVQQSAVTVSGNSFTFSLPANSVMSFVGTMSTGPAPTNTPFAGTPTFTATASPTPHSVMLDDMEDGDTTNNWGGNWYSYSGTGTTITPKPMVMTAGGMTGSPNYRAEIQATVTDYAGMGTNLNSAQTAVDLTNYTAVQFYVKGNGGTYWFQFTQPSITDGDNFGVSFTAPAAWTLVTVAIDAASLTQRGYGTASTFTKNAITALQWASNSNGALDIQIDNVQFLTSIAMSPTNTPVPPTKTSTPVVPTATFTATKTSTAVPPTATYTPTSTATNTRTNTPVPPTATNTSIPPTATDTKTSTPVVPSPTFTGTSTSVPATATFTATNTAIPPSPTFSRTNTAVIPSATNTASIPAATSTTVVNTATPVVSTPTATTFVPTFTPTQAPTLLSTATATVFVPPTSTAVPPTLTNTQPPTLLPTLTSTAIPPSATMTRTSTQAIPSATMTRTSTQVMPTATQTRTLVVPTPTFTGTTGPVYTSIDIKLKEADNNNSTNSPHPQFEVFNTGTTTINLNGFEARYWFNCDCTNQTLQVYVDWAGRGTSGTTITQDVSASIAATALGNQSDYISFKFAGNLTLAPGEMIEIQSRFNKSDWSPMLQSNDWSYTKAVSFIDWNKMTGYLDGKLIYGQEPAAATNTLSVANVLTYPNPTNQTAGATIKYTVAGASVSVQDTSGSTGITDPDAAVILQIFSINGRLVWQSKLSGAPYVSTGEHAAQWIGKGAGNSTLAAGIYTLKVTLNSKTGSSYGFSRIIILKN